MKKNKSVREQLERQYGKGCMFEKAKIEEKIRKKKTIKTYKKFIQEKRFTKRAIKRYRSQMTLHHLRHKSEGGKTTLENGAVLSSLAHMYLHSLPRQQEEYINNELRKYKRENNECKIIFIDDLIMPYKIEPMDFSLEENNKNIYNKKEYNRAKEKRKLKKLEDKYWEEEK